MEFELGAGLVHLKDKVYDCQTCGQLKHTETKNFLTPTKVGISLIYVIK
jgi:hypothetical protein